MTMPNPSGFYTDNGKVKPIMPRGSTGVDAKTFHNVSGQNSAKTMMMNDVDQATVDELELYARNDSELYRHVYVPWQEWAEKRMRKGKPIDIDKMAEGIKKYKVNLIIQKYQKSFGQFPVNSATKKELAKEIAGYVLRTVKEDLDNQGFDFASAGKKHQKYYVTMTDKFMSGWGEAEGKTNKLVIEADTLEEAEIVADNARNRSEMKNVNIAMKKPSYDENSVKTSFHTKDDYQSWFKKGYFKKRR